MKFKKIIGIIVYIFFLLSLVYATIEYIYYIKTNGIECCSCCGDKATICIDSCCECNYNIFEKFERIINWKFI